jgi:GNAT superfamily N-acetyltransferase
VPLAVRAAQPRDLPLLPEIGSSSDTVFVTVGIVFTPGPTVIEQISVHASLIGQGLGRLLLQAAVDEAAGDLILITFRDVPWNGPWYARFGFTELPEQQWGPQLRAHWQAEIDARLHDLGPRLVMYRRRGHSFARMYMTRLCHQVGHRAGVGGRGGGGG